MSAPNSRGPDALGGGHSAHSYSTVVGRPLFDRGGQATRYPRGINSRCGPGRKRMTILHPWLVGTTSRRPGRKPCGSPACGSTNNSMIHATAPLWVGLLIGVAFGVPAGLWGIGNPETIIRTARLVDRLLLGASCSLPRWVRCCCTDCTHWVSACILAAAGLPGRSHRRRPAVWHRRGCQRLLPGDGDDRVGAAGPQRGLLGAIPGGLLGAAAWTLLYQSPFGRWPVTAANFGIWW